MGLDGHEHTETRQQADHRRAAIAHQGKRKAGHWQHGHGHADIHDHVREDESGGANAEERAEIVA